MKISHYIKSSLSRQVIFLAGIGMIIFVVGSGILFYFQHKMQNEYTQERQVLRDRLVVIDEIYNHYNSNFLTMEDSVAFKIPKNKNEILNEEDDIRKQIAELKKLSDTVDEQSIYQDIVDFTNYYFYTLIPSANSLNENNNDRIIELSNSDVTSRVKTILTETRSASNLLRKQLNDSAIRLNEKQLQLQNSIIIFFIIYLILLQFILRKILRSIGKPLTDFALAANEIAAGRDGVLTAELNRKDELGSLSVAFQKMISSVQGKEQDLLAQNEELIAQQDELQAQQTELQVTLDMLTVNEQKLIRRNELINDISTSLDKKKVLQSIVESMCKITESDKGMIGFLHEDTFASFGISEYGVKQFMGNLYFSLNQRLITSKRAFTVKREQHVSEKGFHETVDYCYDLYLPILSTLQEVNAIMIFSRYGDPYSEQEQNESETLAKQISISLEKINLYEQSEENRRLNQDILNSVQEGIQLIDKDGKIVQINQQLGEIFINGDSTDKMIGLSRDQWTSIMAENIQEADFIESLDRVIKAAAIGLDEENSFIYRKSDSNQVIKVYCKTLHYTEEDFGTILVHRDITKEYEVDNMKSEFVSTVSHELRTPLASILGFTELLLTRELKEERKTKYLETIYVEAQRLTALINDFLDIQRMESGKQMYDKKFIDIKPILEKVVEHQEVNTSLHRFELLIESEPTMILGDRSKMEQVFTNLISNAVKYSPNGGKVSIRIYGSEEMVSVDIQDEGLGIPEVALPNLFQRFYRVDNTDRSRIGGTGLGLAIVDEIVKAHGGMVSVSSEYGKGSTFTVHFPKVIMKEELQYSEGATSMLNYNIMVVEDDLSLAKLLKSELQDNGFHVSYFSSGKKALEQLKKAAPDAIVLDILLDENEIDGWTIMEEMKKSETLKNIPIFVSTALDEKERGLSLGAKDYLVKPYKPSQLSKIIMQTLLSNENSGQIMVPQKTDE